MAISGLVLIDSLFIPLEKSLFEPERIASLRIFDKHGTLLREVLSSEEGRGRWCSLKEISPNVINAVIATEDSRFFHHPGVDPMALARATWQNIRARRVVSGGSTISMQVIRNIYHPLRGRRPERTFSQKLWEAWYALRLERMLSKEEVLLQYLNRVPFGNQTFGIDAAARLYFAKPGAQLSIAEAAFLAAIPNSPTMNDPYRHFNHVSERQRYVLSRMKEKGFISEEERERAEHEPLVILPRTAQFKAPHFTTMILSQLSKEEKLGYLEIHTTLDYNVQKTVELLSQSHLARLKRHNVGNGAVVVIDNRAHELVALVGSKDFFDSTSDGQVNGALALRQPGSTLKPFTYGLALENGATAADLLADIPREAGDESIDFLPENYDKKYHGPVRMRTALACSYNVPAVRTVEQFGEEVLLQKLHAAGFESLKEPSSFYGVGLTLGNGEVTLLELCNAYSSLANGGEWSSIRFVDSVKGIGGFKVQGSRFGVCPKGLLRRGSAFEMDSSQFTIPNVFSPQVAYILTDILSDAQARAPAFGVNSSLNLPFPCAAKTGTSKDYKDNWTVGYTPQYTVAVWVGNFNAKPMKMVSGITGAAPLFRDIMLLLHSSSARSPSDNTPALQFSKPEGIAGANICPRSGMVVGESCPGEIHEYFIQGSEPKEVCNVHRKFRLDTRIGLLATRNTPQEFVEEKVFEIFPPIFNKWAEEEGIPKPPEVTVTSREQQAKVTVTSLAINSPTSGDVFKLDPILRPEYQTITVESLVAPEVEHVSLWLNGDEVVPLQPPYRFRLPLASLRKGYHTLVLKGKKGLRNVQSEPVQVAVQ